MSTIYVILVVIVLLKVVVATIFTVFYTHKDCKKQKRSFLYLYVSQWYCLASNMVYLLFLNEKGGCVLATRTKKKWSGSIIFMISNAVNEFWAFNTQYFANTKFNFVIWGKLVCIKLGSILEFKNVANRLSFKWSHHFPPA